MHFEVLTEDVSGEIMLRILIPKIIGTQHTFTIHHYKGIGRIPKNMRDTRNATRRILLENLPKLLKGYGRTFSGRSGFEAAVIVVCDLDDKCLHSFREELIGILNSCSPRPETRFCIAVEEGEAWLLGDVTAIKKAFPTVKQSVIKSYKNDSICGTWELLADATLEGGASTLNSAGWQAVGAQKSEWAKQISPHINVESNVSGSFQHFCRKLLDLANPNLFS